MASVLLYFVLLFCLIGGVVLVDLAIANDINVSALLFVHPWGGGALCLCLGLTLSHMCPLMASQQAPFLSPLYGPISLLKKAQVQRPRTTPPSCDFSFTKIDPECPRFVSTEFRGTYG